MLIDRDSFSYAKSMIFPERTEKLKEDIKRLLKEELDLGRYTLNNVMFDDGKLEIYYTDNEMNMHWFKNSSFLLYLLKDLEDGVLKLYIKDSKEIDLYRINLDYIEKKLTKIFGNIISLTKYL